MSNVKPESQSANTLAIIPQLYQKIWHCFAITDSQKWLWRTIFKIPEHIVIMDAERTKKTIGFKKLPSSARLCKQK